MSKTTGALERVHVASPCPASWDRMIGDDRVRFCNRCERNVYNLSGMSRPEAEMLVQSQEGRLCVRFYRRADGTVLTDDCPIGLKHVRRRLALFAGAAAALLPFFVPGIALIGGTGEMSNRFTWLRRHEPFATVVEWLNPSPPPVIVGMRCIADFDQSTVEEVIDRLHTKQGLEQLPEPVQDR